MRAVHETAVLFFIFNMTHRERNMFQNHVNKHFHGEVGCDFMFNGFFLRDDG